MAKVVVTRPDWLTAPAVSDIYSMSGCISRAFADFISFWRHNGYWLFDAPEIITELARVQAIDLTPTTLFYYEAHETEFSEEARAWQPYEADQAGATNVIPPVSRKLEGFDVVTFFARSSPECSPLSCNGLATEIQTNSHCLLPSLGAAIARLEGGNFRNSEPGPRRVFAVYTVQEPRWWNNGGA